jgi:hypothetical protein
MTNIEKVSAAVSEWLFNVAKSVLPKFTIPADSSIGKFMYGILGVNPASYNVWSELGFLAEPMIQAVVTPMLNARLSGIPDDQIKDLAYKFVDAFIEQAKTKKHVNLFGIQLGENAFVGLKDLLTQHLEE